VFLGWKLSSNESLGLGAVVFGGIEPSKLRRALPPKYYCMGKWASFFFFFFFFFLGGNCKWEVEISSFELFTLHFLFIGIGEKRYVYILSEEI
jgi:hypothetical protein